jgi:hypothetical protein
MTATRLSTVPLELASGPGRARRARPGPGPGGFWFSFAGFGLPRHDDPGRDLDLASYGVVPVLDDNGTDWRPRESFHSLAAAYGMAE